MKPANINRLVGAFCNIAVSDLSELELRVVNILISEDWVVVENGIVIRNTDFK